MSRGIHTKKLLVAVNGNTHAIAMDMWSGTSSRTIVLLHGLQSDRTIFSPVFDDVRFRDATLLAIDLLGFGDSDRPETFSYSLEDHADAILAVLNKCGVTRSTFIGHSLGGMLATLILGKAPESVQALVSLEGNLSGGDCGQSALIARLSQSEFQNSFPSFLREVAESGEPSGALRAQCMAKTSPTALYKTARSITAWSQSNQLLDIFTGAISPRLLITGQRGSFVSRPEGIGVEFSEVLDAGHFMLLDKPAETWDRIAAFYSELQ